MNGPYSASEVVMIIGAISTLLTSAIAAWNTRNTKHIAQSNSIQLDDIKDTTKEVRDLANGNLSEVREELRVALAKLEYMNHIVSGLTDKLPPGVLEEVKHNLESIGRRRKDDILRNGEHQGDK